jgi:1,2-diacylglycerol 3-alpha-glucosyltransferase
MVQLREGLERRGHKVIVITVATPQHREQDPSVFCFPSVSFNRASGFRLGMPTQRAVNQVVRAEKLEVVHTHTEYSLGWAGKRAALRMGLPLVHTAHTMHEEYRHYLFFGELLSARMVQRYLKLFLSGYDTLICPSDKAYNYCRAFVPHLRTLVIGNGIDKVRFRTRPLARGEADRTRAALGIQALDRVILYAGRLAKEKRVLELFWTLVPLLREHPEFKAVFVGDGPSYKALLEAVERSDTARQVILTGRVDWGEMYRLYSAADLFASASLSEVQPMTLIEASMSGLPIVARRDDSCADLVHDGYNGYLVDSDREIAERAAGLLGSEAALRRFSENSLALSDRFTAEGHVEQIESLYQELAQRRGPLKG